MKQKAVCWGARQGGETLEPPPNEQNREKRKRCICGKCRCRKHHCPIHHSTTFNLLPKSDTHNEAMYSHYKYAFQLAGADSKSTRRGLILPPQIIPSIPRETMDLTTENQHQYQQPPLPTSAKNYKPEDKSFASTEPINVSTSYEVDFPRRSIDANPPADTLMRTTIPRRVEVTASAAYTTTNRSMLRKWSGKLARPVAFGEPPQKAFFTGDFCGESVSKQDYGSEVANGRPSTGFKKDATVYKSNAAFDGTTTNISAYKLPIITKKVPQHLRNMSKKANETLEQQVGKVKCITQYTHDNPGFGTFPTRRPICPPQPDNLKLFRGHLASQTESQSNYRDTTMLGKALRPRTSFKITEKLHTQPNAQFSDVTSTGEYFRAVPADEMITTLNEIDKRAAEFGHAQRNGNQVKLTHHFGGKFHDTTTNKSELFQFSKTKPRIRHGDPCETHYKPSTANFNSLSETRAGFPPLKGRPSTSFKPLDVRFKNDTDFAAREKLASVTAYRSDFPVRKMPTASVCPAEALLYDTRSICTLDDI